MKYFKPTLMTLSVLLSSSVFAIGTMNNGVMVDGLNFVLEQSSTNYGQSVAQFGSHNGNWMLQKVNGQNDQYVSQWAQGLKTASPFGQTVKYILLDFPSIDVSMFGQNPATRYQTCKSKAEPSKPSKPSKPVKFGVPGVFNYVEQYSYYDTDLGDRVSSCVGGQAITRAFAVSGLKVIPYISGDGSDINTLEKNNGSQDIKTLATLIARQILNDKNASGVAFDLESSIKGQAANEDFFGTLAASLSTKKGELIFIYDGDWQYIQPISKQYQNIVGMEAMYDRGVAGPDHWFQTLPVQAYVKSAKKAYTAFMNSPYTAGMMKMPVIPAAASDTVWQIMDVMNLSKPDKPGGNGPASYDPYQGFNGKNSSPSDLGVTSNAGDTANPDVNPVSDALFMPVKTSCPEQDDTQGCVSYSNTSPYANSQASYIDPILGYIAVEQKDPASKKVFGIMLYNIKPDNFYSLNCENVVQSKYRCLNLQPSDIPSSVLTLPEWTESTS